MKYSTIRKSLPRSISHFGLYLFAFSIPVSFVPAEFAIGIVFIGWFLEGLLNKRWQYYKTRIFYILIFYVIWNILASSLSPRPWHSLKALADNEWPMSIMIFMLFIIDDVRILRRILHLWLFTAGVAAIYAVWQTFSGFQLHRQDILSPIGSYFRAVGFSGFYLTFAGLMMSVFLIGLCISFQSGIKNRWRYILVTIMSFLGIVGTFARSIWLSIAVVVPIFGFAKGKRVGAIVTFSFIIIVVFTVIFVPAIRDRAVSIFIPSENQTRLNLWRTSVLMSKDHLLKGIGEDNFDYYFDRYKVEGYYDVTGHPHNDYLTVLVSSGVPGLAAFIAIWLSIMWTGFITSRKTHNNFLKELALGSSLAILGFMVGGFFQNYYGTFANCWGWWFMAGLAMTSYRLYRKEGTIK